MTQTNPPVVHLMWNRSRMACGIPKAEADQWCPAGLWPAIRPECRCATCAEKLQALENVKLARSA